MTRAERMEGPNSPKSKDDIILEQLQEWLGVAERADSETEYRTVAAEDYKFYAGQQDDAEVLAKLAQQKRPPTVFNEIKPKIDMLVGTAMMSPFSPMLVPVNVEDEAQVELMSGAVMHYRRKIKLSDKEIDCFTHKVKSGRSLLYFYIDRANPFKPKIMAQRYPGTNFWIDPDSTEYDLSDARYIFLDKWLTEDEIESYWPGFPKEDVKTLSQSSGGEMPLFYNQNLDRYRIVEAWYRKWVPIKWFINPMTGQPEGLEEEEFNQYTAALAKGIPNPETEELIYPTIDEVYNSRVQKIQYAIFSGQQLFESGPSPYQMDMFPCVLYGAYKNDYDNIWFSAITMMKDPQRGINTMRRQLQHLLQTLPKGFLVHEVGSILNIEEYQEKSADPTFHMEVTKGGMDKYKFETQPNISPIYRTFDADMRMSLKETSGITHEMMGEQMTSREPGITVRTRLEATAVVLYMLFDNFRKSRIQGTKILISLIQQYVREPELIRIEGEKGRQLLQINTQMNPQLQGFNDIAFGEYDVEVDEIMENSSTRAATAMLLNDFAHQYPGSIPPDVILEYTNISFTTKQRIREYWQQMQETEQENKDADRAVELAKAVGSLRGKQLSEAVKMEVAKLAKKNESKKEEEKEASNG